MPEGAVVDREQLRRYMDREARVWGQLVRVRRKQLRLTLAGLAKLADTTPQTVFKVEKGQIVPRDDLRIALAMALCQEVNDLFPMPDRKTVAREVAS